MITAMVFSLAFVSCDKDPKEENGITEENGVKRLVSKIETDLFYGNQVWTFKYDEQNRLTEWTINSDEDFTDVYVFEYDANNRVSRVTRSGYEEEVYTLQYVGNQIIHRFEQQRLGYLDTIYWTLNANGQIIKRVDNSEDGHAEFTWIDDNLTLCKDVWPCEEGECHFFLHFTPSNVLNVFRHTTIPDWFWLIDEIGLYFPPGKNMASKTTIPDSDDEDYFEELTFIYETDTAGYVTSSEIFYTGTMDDDYYGARHLSRLANPAFPVSAAFSNANLKSRMKRTPVRKTIDPELLMGTMTFEYIPAK